MNSDPIVLEMFCMWYRDTFHSEPDILDNLVDYREYLAFLAGMDRALNQPIPAKVQEPWYTG